MPPLGSRTVGFDARSGGGLGRWRTWPAELQPAGRMVNHHGKGGERGREIGRVWAGNKGNGRGRHGPMRDGPHKAAEANVRAVGRIVRWMFLRIATRGNAAAVGGRISVEIRFLGHRWAMRAIMGNRSRRWLRCATRVCRVACNPKRHQRVERSNGHQLQQHGDMLQDIPHGNVGGKNSVMAQSSK